MTTPASEAFPVLMVGLPESGKSTYLGALFHLLRSGAGGRFQFAELPAERDYLIELETAWLTFAPLERSRFRGVKQVTMTLQVADPDESVRIDLPDLTGEDYMRAWESGDWLEDVKGVITRARAMLLFVRADLVVAPALIEVEVDRPLSEDAQPQKWNPSEAPTQAILCDLLEQIEDMRGGALPPIAVLVTAWDTVTEFKLSPTEWLAWQTPLLSQWLEARSGGARCRVFGVSAQGGDVSVDAIRNQLARDAGLRPIPPGGNTLMAPLEWLLETPREIR